MQTSTGIGFRLKAHNLANMAWGSATADQSDAALLSAVARIVERASATSSAKARQHGVGVCDAGAIGCVVAWSLGEESGAELRRPQCARARQHDVGVCDCGPVGCGIDCNLGEDSEAALRRVQSAIARNRMRHLLPRWRVRHAAHHQYGVGVCAIGCSIGKDSGAGLRRRQAATPRQHGVDVCDTGSDECVVAAALAKIVERASGTSTRKKSRTRRRRM